jgi:hypothetical protein
LGVLGVASSLDLSLVSAGESNAEHAEEVAVGSLGLDEALDKGVPLLDEGAELVTGDVHAIEVGVAVVSLHFFNFNLNLAPCLLVSLVLQISEGSFEDAATERIGSDFYKIEHTNVNAPKSFTFPQKKVVNRKLGKSTHNAPKLL